MILFERMLRALCEGDGAHKKNTRLARAFSGIWDRTIDITDMSRVLYLLSYSAVGFYTSKKSNFCQAPNEYFFGMKNAIRKNTGTCEYDFPQGKKIAF